VDTPLENVHEREKQMVASFRPPHQRSVNPFVIKDRPEEKQLGISTRSLCVNDFTLIKTLGTGESRRKWRGLQCAMLTPAGVHPGTFARVWLAKFKDEKIRRDNVYALKVLRKADGEDTCESFYPHLWPG
jgi:hypothetical protein